MTMKKHSRKLRVAAAVTALAALGGVSTSQAAELSSLSSSTVLSGTGTDAPETDPAPATGPETAELLVNADYSSVHWKRNVPASLAGTSYPHSYVATTYPTTEITVNNAPEHGRDPA